MPQKNNTSQVLTDVDDIKAMNSCLDRKTYFLLSYQDNYGNQHQAVYIGRFQDNQLLFMNALFEKVSFLQLTINRITKVWTYRTITAFA